MLEKCRASKGSHFGHRIFILNNHSTSSHGTYPSESHLVRGHSHISDRSGLERSDFMNSSGGKPVLPSHSGTYPAPGASLTGGGSMTEARSIDMSIALDWGPTKADAVPTKSRVVITERAKRIVSCGDIVLGRVWDGMKRFA